MILGLAGGPHQQHDDPRQFPHIDGYWHDAAAAVIDRGEVIAAYEEERLTRVPHTVCFPSQAVAACLTAARVRLDQLDAVAVYFTEEYWNTFLTDRRLYDPGARIADARTLIASSLERLGSGRVDPARIQFVRHHEAHAVAAWHGSGFDAALVLTLDGAGDAESGWIASGGNGGLQLMWTLPIKHSLGALYLWITRFLGFGQFDEYKVMGLAAHGDRRALAERLRMTRLLAGGRYEIDWKFTLRLREIAQPRQADEPITAFHADLAAAAQDALEEATLHLLRHARTHTSHRRLCFAGGVAHNCALNAKIAATEQFDEIFVHPASHDAGCALGAALAAEAGGCWRAAPRRIRSVYWGTDVDGDRIASACPVWREWVSFARHPDVAGWAAEELARGRLIALVRGRAEFGPRALGHRSLLADPRPPEIRDRINAAVKRREAFRPFAPVVQLEHLATYFCVPPGIDCSFMSYALPVQPAHRAALGAVTHVDGTARVQTVSRDQDAFLWTLLARFADRTGVPILLNTSLNVGGEPIVDSIDDAIAFLLTAGVDAVAADGWILRRAEGADLTLLAPMLPDDARLSQRPADDRHRRAWILERGSPRRRSSPLTRDAVDLLIAANGRTTLCALARDFPGERGPSVVAEILHLWARRLLAMIPPPRT